ncbi:MAG TPA: DHA2 family efflux MFS transporter permease subunit [Terriglobia bacterium]|nr:DHA2 family efflux MFS transporter permease subunit [Terriglobia bacterium]
MSQEPHSPRGPEWSWHPGHNPWLIALTVTLATFMEVLDTSIANVALPHIAGGLSAGIDESTWVLTSYLVSNAVVLPLSGWLSNRFGRKHFYMTCVTIFATSSFLCGIAPSLEALILFRVLQGVGGGGLQPSEQAILADTFPASKRGMAFAVYGMAVVAAPALGPTLGGWITDNFTWRWIFFINVPVGVASLLLTSRMVTDPPYMRQSKKAGLKIDYIGFALIAIGLGFLQVVLDKGQRDDWFESHTIVVFTTVSVLALAGAIVWEWLHKDPVVDIHLLRDRTFLMANVLMFMVGFALLASTLLLPLFAQTMMGYTAELAGMMISPGGIAIILLLPLVGYLTTHYDARLLIALGLLVVSVSLFRMARFDLGVDFGTLMWTRVLQACGLAFLFVPINTVAYSFLPREKNNAASGFINLSRNIGGSFGISVVTTMLSRRAQIHQLNLVSHVNNYNPTLFGALRGASSQLFLKDASTADAARKAYGLLYGVVARQANMLAYLDDFRLLAVVILVMVPFVFLMKRPGSSRGPLAVH